MSNVSLPRLLVVTSAVSLALTSTALADEASAGVELDSQVIPAASRALEYSVQVGYTRGAGDVGGAMGAVEDLAGGGGGGELKVAYRATPNLAIGAFGSAAGFAHGDQLAAGVRVSGRTAGVFADWHVRPHRAVDPWIELGTGWRGLWLAPATGKGTSLQGLELARVQVGVDYRVASEIAIAPVIGASLSTFLAGDSPATMDHDELDDKQASLYVFGGVQGRFSIH